MMLSYVTAMSGNRSPEAVSFPVPARTAEGLLAVYVAGGSTDWWR